MRTIFLQIALICIILVTTSLAQENTAIQMGSDPFTMLLSKWDETKLDRGDWQHDRFFEHEPLIVWGTLTEESDEDEYDLNEMMAGIVDFRIRKWLNKGDSLGDVVEDVDITIDMIKNHNLILIGTPQSNRILQLIHQKLPIQMVDDETIIAGDQTFEGDEIGAMFLYPNPLNPEKMVWIITAPLYENLRFIPKPKDYVIFDVGGSYSPQSDRFWELAEGDFDEKWQLSKINMVDNEEVDSGENDPVEAGEITHYDPPEWAKHGVMYEIFVRSFYDSDGDGIGDLKGITQKLDYLNDGDDSTTHDLDIEVIWLMPIFDSPSYHGYDVIDYRKINPDYGTNADFQELLREAHRRGIRIVTDLILNHCSNQHPYFQDAFNNPDSKYDRWFYFTNQSNTRAHNWYFRHDKKDRSMLNAYMPAWNVNNPEVIQYLIDTAKYWMDPNGDGDFSDGIDGFRCDYAMGPSHDFWKIFRQDIKSLNPDVLLLAEVWTDMESIATYFNDEFDMAFDFPFQGSLWGSISSGSSGELVSALSHAQDVLPEHALMNRFLNNHDMNRIYSQMPVDKAKLGVTLLLTLPQMPMIYYGDEIGMKGVKDPYDEGIRRPMEWCKSNEDCQGLTSWYPVWNQEPDGISVEEQQGVDGSLLTHFKRILQIRESHPVLETGKVTLIPVMVDGEEYRRALAFVVSNNEERVLVVTNLHEAVDLTLDIENRSLIEVFPASDSQNQRSLTDTNDLSLSCAGFQSYIFVFKH